MINWFIPQLIFLITASFLYYFIIRVQMKELTQSYLLKDMWTGGLFNFLLFTWEGARSILFALFNNAWLALLIIGLAIINKSREYEKDKFQIMLFLGFIPFFLVWSAALLQKYPFAGVRQNIAFMPFLYVLSAFGLYGFSKYTKNMATTLFMISLLACSSGVGLYKKFLTPYSDMPAILAYLKNEFKPGDIILANPYSNWTYKYYREPTVLPENIFLTKSLLENDIQTVAEDMGKYLDGIQFKENRNTCWFIFSIVEEPFEKELFDYVNEKGEMEQVFSSSRFTLYKIARHSEAIPD